MAQQKKSATTALPADITALSYEEAVEELDALIARLEKGSIPLNEAVLAYERGSYLVKHCSGLLHTTEEKIAVLAGDDVPSVVGDLGGVDVEADSMQVPPMRADDPDESDDINGLFDDLE